jgi:hypothetical protein
MCTARACPAPRPCHPASVHTPGMCTACPATLCPCTGPAGSPHAPARLPWPHDQLPWTACLPAHPALRSPCAPATPASLDHPPCPAAHPSSSAALPRSPSLLHPAHPAHLRALANKLTNKLAIYGSDRRKDLNNRQAVASMHTAQHRAIEQLGGQVTAASAAPAAASHARTTTIPPSSTSCKTMSI